MAPEYCWNCRKTCDCTTHTDVDRVSVRCTECRQEVDSWCDDDLCVDCGDPHWCCDCEE